MHSVTVGKVNSTLISVHSAGKNKLNVTAKTVEQQYENWQDFCQQDSGSIN
jgi:hypothetical protein